MKFPTVLAGLVLLAASCAVPVLDRGVTSEARSFAVSVAWGDEAGRGVRALADDAAVDSVRVLVEDSTGTSIGSGYLNKVGAAWKGTLEVSATGPASFRAIAQSSAGKLLYGGRHDQTLSGSGDLVSIAVQTLSLTGGGVQGQELSLLNQVSTFSGAQSAFDSPGEIVRVGTDLYVSDYLGHVIRRVDLVAGTVSTLAGSAGVPGSTNATGTAARFNGPMGLATDGTNLYVADNGSYTVRQVVIATGVVTTVAGQVWGNLDGTGTAARFKGPRGLTLVGNVLYVTDSSLHTVRSVDLTSKVVTTIAGTGTSGSVDATGTSASFYGPAGITNDGTNLYVADNNNHKIRQIVISSKVVTTLAGAGTSGLVDDVGVAAKFYNPKGVATDGVYVYVADSNNHRIRRVTIADGTVVSLAGGNGSTSSGYRDGTGSYPGFYSPEGLELTDGVLHVADTGNYLIRRVTTEGVVTTVAGTHDRRATLDGPSLPELDNQAFMTTDGIDLFVTASGEHTVKRVSLASGAVSVLAGARGVSGSADGEGTAARFNGPQGITTDGTNLYVADAGNQTIRRIVIASGEVSTLAGQAGAMGSTNGQGTFARFSTPYGITTDGSSLFVADEFNNAIRQIVIATGEVTTLAGGSYGYSDDTGTAAKFSYPMGITTDGTNLYASDMMKHTIRKITIAGGVVTTFAGTIGSSGATDGTGTAALLRQPTALVCDGTNLYFTESSNNLVRKIVIATAVTSTIAGSTTPGEVNGTGSAARFSAPQGITTDGINLYVSDLGNNSIRKIH